MLIFAAVAAIVTEPFTDELAAGDVTVTSNDDPAGLVVEPPEELPLEPELDPDPELEPDPELDPEPPSLGAHP